MIKPLTVAAVGVTIAMFVSGCSGSTASTSSTTPASSAAASVAASAAAPLSSASASAAAAQWCAGYTEITTTLSQGGVTAADAVTSLAALDRFDRLWADGGDLGYFSQEETDANRRTVAAYSVLVSLVADGAGPESAEVKLAQANLAASTSKDDILLTAATNKVVTLCGAEAAGRGGPSPSTAASPSAS